MGGTTREMPNAKLKSRVPKKAYQEQNRLNLLARASLDVHGAGGKSKAALFKGLDHRPTTEERKAARETGKRAETLYGEPEETLAERKNNARHREPWSISMGNGKAGFGPRNYQKFYASMDAAVGSYDVHRPSSVCGRASSKYCSFALAPAICFTPESACPTPVDGGRQSPRLRSTTPNRGASERPMSRNGLRTR